VDLGLSGKTAIVTGASQGIGRAIAHALAAEGADLVLTARRQEQLDEVAREVEKAGVQAHVVAADVTDVQAAATIFASALDRYGRVDVVVNNAGKGSPKPLLDLTDDDWQHSFELNFMSAVRLALAAVPHMRERGTGRIINIASRAGREPDPYFAPYAAAKAAMINFTKALSNAFAGDGVLTTCVVPGLVRTPAIDDAAERSAAATGKSVEEVMELSIKKRGIPIGRIAALVAFLASDRASWITGSMFTIDGGTIRSA
jgi:3-oxoacyl-[acyl-carrier protein] reductase